MDCLFVKRDRSELKIESPIAKIEGDPYSFDPAKEKQRFGPFPYGWGFDIFFLGSLKSYKYFSLVQVIL